MFIQTYQSELAECLCTLISVYWRGDMFYLSQERTNMLSVVERGSNWVLAPTKRTRPAGLLQLGQGGDAPDPRQVSRARALRAQPTSQSDNAVQRNNEGSCLANVSSSFSVYLASCVGMNMLPYTNLAEIYPNLE